MNCKYYKTRTKNSVKVGYCTLYKQETHLFCTKECKTVDYKKIKKTPLKSVKTLKYKTTKLKQKEDRRYSILQNNMSECYFCRGKADDIHELLKGRNRQKCMKWGLCVGVCRKCHEKTEIDSEFYKKYRKVAQKKWQEYYNKNVEEFIKEFGRSYLV